MNNEKKKYECSRCTKDTWKDDRAAKRSLDRYGTVVCHGCAIKLGNLEKYGVENASSIPGVQEKKDATKEKHFGDKNFNNREKAMKTEVEHFGQHHFKDETVKAKIRETLYENYGVYYPQQSAEIRERTKATSLERYGTESPSSSLVVREKIVKTNLERYGVENASNIPGVQEKKEATKEERYGDRHFNNRKKAVETEVARFGDLACRTEEVKERTVRTSLERYGTKYPHQSEEVKGRTRTTCEERYGGSNPMSSQEVRDKVVKTNRERYGADYGLSNENVIAKREKTNLERYGNENVGFLAKPWSYIYEDHVFDSSWEAAFWIWHRDRGIEIVHNTTRFFLRDDGRKVYPDFVVDGKFYETKGDHLRKLHSWPIKKKCYDDNGVTVLFWKDCEKYGKKYLKSFRRNST